MTSHTKFIQVFAREGGIHVIQIKHSAVVDQAQVEQTKREILAVVDSSPQPLIILSLGGVTHMSSAMLGNLILVHRRIKEKGGQMCLAYIPDAMAPIIKMIKLDKVIPIYKDLDQALEKMPKVKPIRPAKPTKAAPPSEDDLMPDADIVEVDDE